jgi:hypothetical protein
MSSQKFADLGKIRPYWQICPKFFGAKFNCADSPISNKFRPKKYAVYFYVWKTFSRIFSMLLFVFAKNVKKSLTTPVFEIFKYVTLAKKYCPHRSSMKSVAQYRMCGWLCGYTNTTVIFSSSVSKNFDIREEGGEKG